MDSPSQELPTNPLGTQPTPSRDMSWTQKVMKNFEQDVREQPWKQKFKDHDKGDIEEDWCNLKLPNNVQGNNMAA